MEPAPLYALSNAIMCDLLNKAKVYVPVVTQLPGIRMSQAYLVADADDQAHGVVIFLARLPATLDNPRE
jgi:hypothetical protein